MKIVACIVALQLSSSLVPRLLHQSLVETTLALPLNKDKQLTIPAFSFNSSLDRFGSTSFSSSDYVKPLLSFPIQLSNKLNETKLNECVVHQSIPVHKYDSSSPSTSM